MRSTVCTNLAFGAVSKKGAPASHERCRDAAVVHSERLGPPERSATFHGLAQEEDAAAERVARQAKSETSAASVASIWFGVGGACRRRITSCSINMSFFVG
jgi:hypothetical protein